MTVPDSALSELCRILGADLENDRVRLAEIFRDTFGALDAARYLEETSVSPQETRAAVRHLRSLCRELRECLASADTTTRSFLALGYRKMKFTLNDDGYSLLDDDIARLRRLGMVLAFCDDNIAVPKGRNPTSAHYYARRAVEVYEEFSGRPFRKPRSTKRHHAQAFVFEVARLLAPDLTAANIRTALRGFGEVRAKRQK